MKRKLNLKECAQLQLKVLKMLWLQLLVPPLQRCSLAATMSTPINLPTHLRWKWNVESDENEKWSWKLCVLREAFQQTSVHHRATNRVLVSLARREWNYLFSIHFQSSIEHEQFGIRSPLRIIKVCNVRPFLPSHLRSSLSLSLSCSCTVCLMKRLMFY